MRVEGVGEVRKEKGEEGWVERGEEMTAEMEMERREERGEEESECMEK